MLLLLHHPLLFEENQRKLKTQQEGFLAPLPGRSSLKSRHTKYPSQTHLPRIHYLPFASHFPLPHFTLAVLFTLLLFVFLFALMSYLAR